ncbi:peptide methionine sulfoxide reductase msrB, variant 2 [Coprinopsis cinerea AmutBmut pab1-1]|nr:peptide methionine sulfoxide reductase msrB, variant 2 [Coprinopsis cinerea AmutBmut pab1-1]
MFLRSRRFLSSAVRLRTPRPVAVSSLSFTPVALAQFNSRNMSTSVKKTEEEWRAVLSPEQFRILRQKGTEPPGTGEYNKHKAEGVYNCAGCGTPLYKSSTKFDSGCGWPAFFDGRSLDSPCYHFCHHTNDSAQQSLAQ